MNNDEVLKPFPIKRAWDALEAMTMPATASEEQRKDMRMAFFAGAALMFQMEVDLAGLPEEKAVAAMNVIHEELREFGRIFDILVLMKNIPPGGSA